MGQQEHDAFRELSVAVLAVNRHLTVREVLQTIVSAARELLGSDYAALGVPDDQGGFAEFVVDGVSDEQWDAIGPLPRQHGMLAQMLHNARPILLEDVRKDPHFGWWPRAHPALKGFLGMPISHGDQILGALFLANESSGGFTEEDEELLAVLAAHAAIALTNARLYEHSRELTLLEERHRVARELHDAVAQKLFSLRLLTEAATVWVRRDPGRAETELAEIKRLATLATEELGQIVAELRPRELADLGLVEILRRRVALLDRVHEASVQFTASGTVKLTTAAKLTSGAEEAVLRITEEALHNALRHAQASRVAVRLSTADDHLVCTIADDGTGISQEESRGLGLASMRERAERIGGTLDVTSKNGTTITVRVPLDL